MEDTQKRFISKKIRKKVEEIFDKKKMPDL